MPGMSKEFPDIENCVRVATILKSMAHPQRLFILCRLQQKECTVTELEELIESSQPQISQHLQRMRHEGLVDSRREGNFVYYSVRDDHVKVLLDALEDLYGLSNN
jgi:ArsR family transcriptional regulator, virulence genes transcriptional regulator